MRWLKPGLVAFIYVLGIFFCMRWRPWEVFLLFFPVPLLLFGASLFLFSAFHRQARALWTRAIELPALVWMALSGGIAFSAAAYLAYGPLEGIPHVPDDICYLWQARTFAIGKLYAPSHDLREFFNLLFFVNDGKWYSLFQPGWPALLMLGVFAGMEYLINPILSAVAVVLVYPIGRRVFSDRSARLAMLMLAFSPMHTTVGATLLAHTFSMVLTEIAVLAVLRLGEKNRTPDALILGLALGWLFTARALNGIAMIIVVSIPLTYYLFTKKVSPAKLAAGIPIALGLLCLQLAYNEALTGDPFYWPQDRYFDLTEPKKGCHRLGFGKDVGCPKVHPNDVFPDGFGPADAIGVTYKRIEIFLLTLFGWNLVFFFVGMPLLSKRHGPGKYFLLSVFLSLLVGYFFFYFHGIWGRYYYESAFALFLLVAAGFFVTNDYFAKLAERLSRIPARLLKALIPAVAATYFGFNTLFFFPTTVVVLSNFFFGVDSRMEHMANSFTEKSVIFLDRKLYQAAFIFMRPEMEEKRLYVLNLGKHNFQIMQYYPGWKFYRYNLEKDVLTPINDPMTRPSPIFLEAEYKLPISESSGEYADCEEYIAKDGRRASGKFILTFDAKGPGAYMSFDQFVFKSGRYDIILQLPTGPDRGEFSLSVDGRVCPGVVDLYSEVKSFTFLDLKNCGPFDLSRGKHKFTFKVCGKADASNGYRIGIDYVNLTLVKR